MDENGIQDERLGNDLTRPADLDRSMIGGRFHRRSLLPVLRQWSERCYHPRRRIRNRRGCPRRPCQQLGAEIGIRISNFVAYHMIYVSISSSATLSLSIAVLCLCPL